MPAAVKKVPKRVWCVRHHDGWCAIQDNQPHHLNDNNTPTLCGQFVVLNYGTERRFPDCHECAKKLSE